MSNLNAMHMELSTLKRETKEWWELYLDIKEEESGYTISRETFKERKGYYEYFPRKETK